jgi:hypothetical protein
MLGLYSTGLMILVNYKIENQTHIKIGYLLILLSVIFYSTTALRDPGVYKPNLCH